MDKTDKTSAGTSKDQLDAAWSDFCRDTPVALRGPWEAFKYAWETPRPAPETGDGVVEAVRIFIRNRRRIAANYPNNPIYDHERGSLDQLEACMLDAPTQKANERCPSWLSGKHQFLEESRTRCACGALNGEGSQK